MLRKVLAGSCNLLLLLAMAFVCSQASAKLAYEYREDGTAGVYWMQDYDEEDNEISYEGPIDIPERVVNDGKTYVVTEILPGSFADYNIFGNVFTSLSMPNTIKTIGENAFAGCDGLKTITIGRGVTSISETVFWSCENLEEVVFNAIDCEYTGHCEKMGAVWSVTGMFDGCDNIRNIKLGEGVKRIPNGAFSGLEHVESVQIPESVTHIGIGAFGRCTSLTSITIPQNVTYIGDVAFENCDALSSVTFNAEVCTYMGSYHTEVFEYCRNVKTLTIGENVTIIPDYAFSSIEGIKTVVIPNAVKIIGDDAFRSCGLESLTLGNSVTTIGMGAFDGSNLSSVTIPSSVTAIHSYAFGNGLDDNHKIKPLSVVFNAENCNTVINKWRDREGPDTTTVHIGSVFTSEVSSLTIGDKVKKIPYYLFAGCDFKEVVIPYSVKEIGDSAFLNCEQLEYAEIKNPMTRIGKHAFGGCALLKTANIPETATEIEDGTYYGCKALEDVTIPKTVKTIGRVAFFGCSNLSHVAMGDSVETVGDKAFGDCKLLESFALGEHAKAIGAEAFAGCTAMKNIAVFAAVPPECGSDAFKGIDLTACTLSVPAAYIELYKAAPQWKEFFSISGIDDIAGDKNATHYDVYNLQGILVGRALTEADLASRMPRGVYILVSPQGRKKLKI